MPSRNQKPIFLVPPPLYGLNDKMSAFMLSEYEAAALENVNIESKQAETILGHLLYGNASSGSGPVQNGIDYRRSDGTNAIIRARSNLIEKYNGVTGDWDTVTLPISITSNQKVSFAVLNNLLVISTEVNSDITYDGTTATERASNPKVPYQIMFENRLLKFDPVTSRLYYSAINDPTTFGALDYIMVDPNNASLGKGISELNGQIVVFKQNKKYQITELVGGSVIPLDGNESTVSHYSIASTGRSLIFLSTDGWYELTGSTTKKISDNIDISKLEASGLDTAHAIFHDGIYRCFVPESGSDYNNLEYCFHLTMGTPYPNNPYAVTRNRGRNGLCYIKVERGSQVTLLFGDSRPNTGSPSVNYANVYELFTGNTNNGEELTGFWESKLFDASSPYFQKKYNKIYTRVINEPSLTYKLAYRFATTDAWSDISLVIPGSTLEWTLDDASETENWLEDYPWPFVGSEDVFIQVSNTGKPRTIQFRNKVTTATAKGQWAYQYYQARIKNRFK